MAGFWRILLGLFLSAPVLGGCSKEAPVATTAAADKSPTGSGSAAGQAIRIVREVHPYDLDGYANSAQEMQRLCLLALLTHRTQKLHTDKNHTDIPLSKLIDKNAFKEQIKGSVEEIFSGTRYVRHEIHKSFSLGDRDKDVEKMVEQDCAPVVTTRKSSEVMDGCITYLINHSERRIEVGANLRRPECAQKAGSPSTQHKTPVVPSGATQSFAGVSCVVDESATDSSFDPKKPPSDPQALKAWAQQAKAHMKQAVGDQYGKLCYLQSQPFYAPLGNLPVIVAKQPSAELQKKVAGEKPKTLDDLQLSQDGIGTAEKIMAAAFDYLMPRTVMMVETPKVVQVGAAIEFDSLGIPVDAQGFTRVDPSGLERQLR